MCKATVDVVALLQEERNKLTAENTRLKEELCQILSNMIDTFPDLDIQKTTEFFNAVEVLKSRQLGKFQVAVDVPEVNEWGDCNGLCPISYDLCKFRIMEHKAGLGDFSRPGPGCPRWEGSDG